MIGRVKDRINGVRAKSLLQLGYVTTCAASAGAVWVLISERVYENPALFAVCALLVFAVFAAGTVSFVMTRRSVINPLLELRVAMEEFAAGAAGFSAELTEHGSVEVSALHREFGAFVQKTQGVIERMLASSETLSVASQQVASTTEQTGGVMNEISDALARVAAGADRQVQTVEATQATVADMAEAARATAGNAEEARETTESARLLTQRGMLTSGEAAQAMDGVRATVQDTAEVVHQLGERSKGIDAIVDTITGIASQTNMLALNAAIEAARAGEQGRGFAVVADQVRKLAEESGQAAGHIAELVGEIQTETARAVQAMESGLGNVAEAVTTSQASRDAFEEIRGAVEDIDERVQRIVGSSARLTDGSAEVESAIAEVAMIAQQSFAATQQVSVSTEQTVASTQQIAGAVIQLARIADELGAEAQKFGRAA
jgi:methyl-accepting chemotaxis protein